MNWVGYTPYQQFIARLQVTNPGAATIEKNSPQEWRPAKASVYYTNTPERASSTFVRNIRYLPQSQIAFVRLGNSQYWYGMTPRQMSQWLTSNSLGKYYNNYMKLR